MLGMGSTSFERFREITSIVCIERRHKQALSGTWHSVGGTPDEDGRTAGPLVRACAVPSRAVASDGGLGRRGDVTVRAADPSGALRDPPVVAEERFAGVVPGVVRGHRPMWRNRELPGPEEGVTASTGSAPAVAPARMGLAGRGW